VNTDPVVSPKKVRRALADDKPVKTQRVSFVREDQETRASKSMDVPGRTEVGLERRERKPTVCTGPEREVPVFPKTPMVDDMFSPSSQPSTGDGPKDTPPPSDLSSSALGMGLPVAGRPSRRARAAINYAEPSLNSKMRRPTKELLDAVGRDGRPIPGTVVKKITDKKEEVWHPKSWAAAPTVGMTAAEVTSPLVAKSAPAPHAPSCRDCTQETTENGSSAEEQEERQLRDEAEVESEVGISGQPKADDGKDDLGIFDFTESSPNERSLSFEGDKSGETSRRRRASAIAGSRQGSLERGSDGDNAASERMGRVSSRRRSMML